MATVAGTDEGGTREVVRDRHGSVISTRPLPIDFERPAQWNRWLRKAIHYWRYGYSHPDEDLLGVIDALGDTLNVHIMSARAVLTDDRAKKADEIKNRLDRELRKKIPDFSTLLGLEAEVNALYPPEMAKRRQWMVRERFERVAPASAFQSWQVAQVGAQLGQATDSGLQPRTEVANRPDRGQTQEQDQEAPAEAASSTDQPPGGDGPDGGGGHDGGGGGTGGGTGGTGNPDAADPDTQILLGYIHANYLLTIAREKAVRDLKRWLLMRFWFFLILSVPALAAVWAILWWNGMGNYWGLLLGLFLVAAVGRAGAMTSIIRRMQTALSDNVLASDPVIELTALRTGKNEVSLALLSSSVFALLMYAFFLSGVPRMMGFQAGIFPEPANATAAAGSGSADRPETATPAVILPSPAPATTAPATTTPATSPAAPPAPSEAGGTGANPAAAGNSLAAQPAPAAAAATAPKPPGASAASSPPASAASSTPVATTAAARNDSKKAPTIACGEGENCDTFDALAQRLGLRDSSDFFKLLLWAFIAGFAERFVPDMLDRVVSRGRGTSAEGADARFAAQMRASAETMEQMNMRSETRTARRGSDAIPRGP